MQKALYFWIWSCLCLQGDRIRRNFYPTILMHVPCIFTLFVLQPTNAPIYITVFSLYIMFTPACFNTSVSSSGSLKNLYFAMVHQSLELQPLKLQLHKRIRWKLFGCHWVIQYSLCNVTVSCERSVFMWLHIQSLVTVLCLLVWHDDSRDTVTSYRLYCITQWQPNNFHLIILWNCNFKSFNSNNWCTVAKYKFLKLPEDDTEVSKHVEVNDT